MSRRLARDVIADAAARLDDLGESALADELRSINLPGRKRDDAHRARLMQQRDWMRQKIREGHDRDQVLKAVASRQGGTVTFWDNILSGAGRPDLKN